MRKLIRRVLRDLRMSPMIQSYIWMARNYSMPSPEFIKRKRLLCNAGGTSTWIETGTYLGETTRLLAKTGAKVISIEPHLGLFKAAKIRLRKFPNVELVNAVSEEVMQKILGALEDNADVALWLDGHFSGAHTFEGKLLCPVLKELEAVAESLNRFSNVTVFVDDVRLFNSATPTGVGYPSLNDLVEWANRCGMTWWIEHDVFVAKTGNYHHEFGSAR